MFNRVYDPTSVTYNFTLQWRVELDCTSNTVVDYFIVDFERDIGGPRNLIESRNINTNLVCNN